MKNNKFLMNAVIVILFTLFNIIVFQAPLEHTDGFWYVYGFTCIAFAMQLYVTNGVLVSDEKIKSKFLGYSVAYVSGAYLLVQLLLCYFVMVNSDIAQWKIIVLNSIVLAFALIGVCFTQIGKNYIGSIDEKVANKTSFIRIVSTDAEIVFSELKDEKEREAMSKLMDVIKYSDPVSSPALAEVEKEISNKMVKLKECEKKVVVIENLEKLFVKRNLICKARK